MTNPSIRAAFDALIEEIKEALDEIPFGTTAEWEKGHDYASAEVMKVLDKYIDQEATSAVMQWRPIESAPLAVDILLYCPDRGIANRERIECGYAGNGRGSYHAWATHWMPLPPPPSETNEEK